MPEHRVIFKRWGVFFSAAAIAVLIAVFISQYIFHMPPCHLCLWQRWPYAVASILGLMMVGQANETSRARGMLGLLVATFAVSAGLGLFHWGVENKWWIFASDCTGNAFKPGASTQDILAALKKAPVVRCDEVRPFLFGMTMAFYNALISFVLGGIALYALTQSFNRDQIPRQKRFLKR